MTLEDSIFEKHYNYYKSIGIETIKQQAGQVEQVSSDYQGRVIYELLQNAFDKANKNILVQVKGNSLFVANDGEKFTFVADYDYDKGSSERGDFQSMCSISTSTKNASTSIGNKGVGFKSAFSIAESGFVNVYTQGEIISSDKSKLDEVISFRIYDSFKDINNIPSDFEVSIKNNLIEKIGLVQKERVDRGVPGYYFPLHFNDEPPYILELFNQGFVTVIEIPFNEKDSVKALFNEIEDIHFQFIKLKKHNDFSIVFQFDEDIYEKKVEKELNKLFSCTIDSDVLKELAQIAGISIEHPQVAFLIKDEPNGLLYNYLPTKVSSPFSYVDFHADFHTTVDRKSINFEGKIGKYNKALLKACIELYFSVINNYLEKDKRIELKTEFIDKTKITCEFENFDWRLFYIQGNTTELFKIVRSILQIWDWHYSNSVNYFAQLAQSYFSSKRNKDKHQEFLSNSLSFIYRFATDSQKYEVWIERFRSEFAGKLLDLNAQIIPNTTISKNNEIIFRKTSDSIIQLPEFLGVNITDFEITDNSFRRSLGINEFNDYNVILKYFKQCSFEGKYKTDAISEDEQRELIKSLFQIFDAKKEQSFLTSHRYTKLRDDNSSLNQANFNVSTIFLKTDSNKYKPAQLCFINEIDKEFLKDIIPESQISDFLRFIGVSIASKHLCVDVRMYNELKDGIDYLPSLVDRKDERIDVDLISENIRIVTPSGRIIHPATVNNNYRFLDNLIHQPIKKEIDNLVNDYSEFSKPYRQKLMVRILENLSNKDEVIRLYQSIFWLFAKEQKYLLIDNNKLSWSSSIDFVILNNKSDFDLLISQESISTKVLCYYSGGDFSEDLKKRIVVPKKGKIETAGIQINDNLKKCLQEKMIYLLINISRSKSSVSDRNYLDEDTDLLELQNRLELLEVIEVQSLKQEIFFNNIYTTPSKDYVIDVSKGKIYFRVGINTSKKAEGISEYLFSNSSIKELVELIVFYKEVDQLKDQVNSIDFESINKKWKTDYQQKWLVFLYDILGKYVPDISQVPLNWHCYNHFIKSNLLIRIEREEGLLNFEERINQTKSQFEGYFDSFKLDIDYNLNRDRIEKMKTFLQLKDSEDTKLLLYEIDKIQYKLGIEELIQVLENKTESIFNDFRTYNELPKSSLQKKRLNIEEKVNDIFKIMSNSTNKNIKNTTQPIEYSTSEAISHRPNRKIFKIDSLGNSKEVDFELMGASGEIEVLNYYIKDFIEHSDIEYRSKGIKEVYNLVVDKLPSKEDKFEYEQYRDKCIENINIDFELQKALIPFYYITMHFKFAFFDLAVYKQGKPTLVEVKTTYSEGNNRFFLSMAEVNAAMGKDEYEIIRVTPSSIYFLENPIKAVEEKIKEIRTNKFTLTPKNYEFNFIDK